MNYNPKRVHLMSIIDVAFVASWPLRKLEDLLMPSSVALSTLTSNVYHVTRHSSELHGGGEHHVRVHWWCLLG